MSVPARFAAVLFDMDGLLLDTEPLWATVLAEEARRLRARLTAEARTRLVGASMNDTAVLLLELAGISPTQEHITGVNTRVRHDIRQHFDGPLPWRPGARDALAAVRAAGFPTALVTSTEADLVAKALRTLGSANFDVIVCASDVGGNTKPHPLPYLMAAHQLGVHPTDCLAIEDSDAGSRSAMAAGCTTLVIPYIAPVPPVPGRLFRQSLIGFNADDIAELFEHRRPTAQAPTPGDQGPTPIYDAIVADYDRSGVPSPLPRSTAETSLPGSNVATGADSSSTTSWFAPSQSQALA